MATNYQRGRSREYRIMNKLREEGYNIVARTAGSHSEIDIIAIRRSDWRIRFIQAKPKKMSQRAQDRLKEPLQWLNQEFICSFEVMSKLKPEGGKNDSDR